MKKAIRNLAIQNNKVGQEDQLKKPPKGRPLGKGCWRIDQQNPNL